MRKLDAELVKNPNCVIIFHLKLFTNILVLMSSWLCRDDMIIIQDTSVHHIPTSVLTLNDNNLLLTAN